MIYHVPLGLSITRMIGFLSKESGVEWSGMEWNDAMYVLICRVRPFLRSI